jgi:acyl carrier protein
MVKTKKAMVAPTNATENRILAIWKEILENDHIGITDNFFEVGGHSFRAMQVQSLLNQAFQTDIPVKEIFTRPTIQELAAYINSFTEVSEEVAV